ncbi:bifunctional 23S rRNA (guanine(2069)-N(7))-methyltransferase RlmK/23S rRNA (guanine(2445)-N(2))-methyltransferase RlmL [Maricurvus nonylphenolicus]|uniref:bifunctional 23S rRNA (guanine(2069)-N(7))-methyltransferase RlmK/23S rRNA (guanine(2445)-N(2))-methyltransferase RlmL n=1 Tax=Maricurvus nonylphenolicus TaxID=1008307 RepID=UPI0036F27B2B
MIQQYFATCPKGLESLLLQELQGLGMDNLRETVAGVYFETDLKGAYSACLWSRLANKILMPLGRFDVGSQDDLYQAARSIDWQEHLNPHGTLLVDFSGTDRTIRNSQFGALKIKDAVVDCLRDASGQRPSVAKRDPDLRINARLNRGKVVISLDLAGDSLHRRGYRTRQGAAPLKENLAAAVLMRANWPQIADEGGALIDPMCGSGTLLIEAAMMAADCAPGIRRQGFGFERWLNHQNDIWLDLREEALERRRQGMESIPEIRGYDGDPRVLRAAESNIAMAQMAEHVRVTCKPLHAFKRPTHTELGTGLLVTNPPYGERLGEVDELKGLYRQLGDKCREELPGWQVAVFTGNPQLGKHMGLRAHKRYKLFNGSLPSELLLLRVEESQFVDAPAPDVASQNKSIKLSSGAEMLVNRLRKNSKQFAKWLKKESIGCYRLYDADMPEYSAAIDVYTDTEGQQHVHVQEYQAPKSIDERKVEQRFAEIQAAVPVALEIQPEAVSYKQRRRNRGKEQYERQTKSQTPPITVVEGQAKLSVNLWDYLDTGLFLDHRPVRKMIAEMVRGKDFLNLFCYTATASVHAALAGAASTTSVDMSKTYLKWAQKNFELNNIRGEQHLLEQGDCLQWLKDCRRGFDVIMLDPPSFSNSKRMDNVLDIQRDHVGLVKRCMELLKPGGTLVFSNNLRTFKLNTEALAGYQIKDITQQSLDPDFKRNSKIHKCWLISHS